MFFRVKSILGDFRSDSLAEQQHDGLLNKNMHHFLKIEDE